MGAPPDDMESLADDHLVADLKQLGAQHRQLEVITCQVLSGREWGMGEW